MKAEEERRKKEAEEEAEKRRKAYKPPSGLKNSNYTNQTINKPRITESEPLSIPDMDSMEEALEELVEGGGF